MGSPKRRSNILSGAAVLCAGGISVAAPVGSDGDPTDRAPVDFALEVRPILAEHCFACHGPDAAARQAGLRLDEASGAMAPRGDAAAIRAGDPEHSLVLRRIVDDADPMPPLGAGERLTTREVETLVRWVAEGAPWGGHWSYVTPVRPPVPVPSSADWPINPIDNFILAKLESTSIEPAPPAEAAKLLRRVSYDLTGLPPTVAELDAFESDTRADAYERAVRRLLDSPRYGEELATDWLDAARYGDTHGLHLDNVRSLWRWRDWVIDAYNANKPFDEFTVEQMAGDLLPGATVEQRIATGFHRCNTTTGEGGLIDAEYLVNYAVDRAETTATVWLGSTLGCAVCHDHKYDPFSQEEFYRFFAFFNSIDERASDENALAPPPNLLAPLPGQAEELERFDARLAEADAELEGPIEEVDAEQESWERRWEARLSDRWRPLETLYTSSMNGTTLRLEPDGALQADGENPDKETYEILARTDLSRIAGLRLEALTSEFDGTVGVGRSSHSNIVLTGFEVEAMPADASSGFEPVPLMRAEADYSQAGYDIRSAIDGSDETGWAIDGGTTSRVAVFVPERPLGWIGGTVLRVRLVQRSKHPRHNIGRFRLSASADPTLAPARAGAWQVSPPFPAPDYDSAWSSAVGPEVGAATQWAERPAWEDGAVHALEGGIAAVYLRRTMRAAGARSLEIRVGSDDGLVVWANGSRVFESRTPRPAALDQDRFRLPLRAGENSILVKVVNAGGAFGFAWDVGNEELGGLPFDVADALVSNERSVDQGALVRHHFRSRRSPEWKARWDERVALSARRDAFAAEIPVTMVVAERAEPRPAHVLIRGRYDQPGAPVEPGVPAVLTAIEPEGERATRLELARWLVDPSHPLTARVAVNRLWQRFFGSGLVATPEDFGSRGALPSHPALLDWLSAEYIASGWDTKHLVELIVTSAAYRQDSSIRAELSSVDPLNRLIARGPRFRLDAEAIRDGALYMSGLLVEKVGGPSVRPYQPPGVWSAVGYTGSNTANFVRDDGEALWRRSMYTFWKRTAPPPSMALFDAPSRESCTVQRARTNTPLQALALLNDEQFVEAARAFGERLLREGGDDDASRLTFGFRTATSRRPNAAELELLQSMLAGHRAEFAADPEAAAALIAVGESTVAEGMDEVELASWTLVASALLNLDETVTRG